MTWPQPGLLQARATAAGPVPGVLVMALLSFSVSFLIGGEMKRSPGRGAPGARSGPGNRAGDAGERVADGPVRHVPGLADGGGQALEGGWAVRVVEDRGCLPGGRRR